MKLLITGCAGFIGYHLSKKLLEMGHQIIGLDNLNNYYDVNLKKKRIQLLKSLKVKKEYFIFKKIDISNKNKLIQELGNHKFDAIVNLAAQAGVRYSIKYPNKYYETDVQGFFNILELSRITKVKHLVYASTSSVYGNIKKLPFKEDSNCKPIQFYAATKLANESMATAYSEIYKIKTTGFRFFTVYGPMGRPDMALFKFSENILKNKPIKVFNYGNHTRDLTYIDDIVQGVVNSIILKTSYSSEVFNLGCSKSIGLMKIVQLLKKNYNKKILIDYVKFQQGDIKNTKSSILKAKKVLNYNPKTTPSNGIKLFCDWFKIYHEKK